MSTQRHSPARQRWVDKLERYRLDGNQRMVQLTQSKIDIWDVGDGWASFDAVDEWDRLHPRQDGAGPEYCECDAETRVCSCEPIRLGRRDADADDDSFDAAMARLDAAEAAGALPSAVFFKGTPEQGAILNARWDVLNARLDNGRTATERHDTMDPRDEMIARHRAMAFATDAQRADAAQADVERTDATIGTDSEKERNEMIARRRTMASNSADEKRVDAAALSEAEKADERRRQAHRDALLADRVRAQRLEQLRRSQ